LVRSCVNWRRGFERGASSPSLSAPTRSTFLDKRVPPAVANRNRRREETFLARSCATCSAARPVRFSFPVRPRVWGPRYLAIGSKRVGMSIRARLTPFRRCSIASLARRATNEDRSSHRVWPNTDLPLRVKLVGVRHSEIFRGAFRSALVAVLRTAFLRKWHHGPRGSEVAAGERLLSARNFYPLNGSPRYFVALDAL
jgi:hypothetical protein